MPDSYIPYGADPGTVGRRQATVKRTETRDGTTAEFNRDVVVLDDRRARTFKGVGATFRIIGSAAIPQPLWSIENTTGSAVAVALRRLYVGVTQTAANLTHPPWFYLFRTSTMPTGGTTMTKTHPDGRSAETSAGNVIVRSGASADATLSAITAPFAGARLATLFGSQLYTAVGQGTPLRLDMLAGVADEAMEYGWLVLGAGQAYVLHVTAAAAADNIAARSFVVDFAWSEFTDY